MLAAAGAAEHQHPGLTWMSDAAPVCVDGVRASASSGRRRRAPPGIAVTRSLLIVVCRLTLWVSMIGVSPVTVIVSSIEPTFSSRSRPR